MSEEYLPPPFITVEDQQLKTYRDWVGKGKDFQVNDMVMTYNKYGHIQMRISAIIDTAEGEHIKVYELKNADGSTYHATKDFIDKI